MVAKIGEPPRCHPDRPYFAKGLCGQCYQARRARADRARTNKQNRNYSRSHPNKVREFQLRYAYGLEPGQYEAMLLAQGGCCAICKKQKKLCVDHCHRTDQVRGLLCHACNVAVGMCETREAFLPGLVAYLQKAEGLKKQTTPFSQAVDLCLRGEDPDVVARRLKVKPAKLKTAVLERLPECDDDDVACLFRARLVGRPVFKTVKLFLEHFQDPAECCPYDGAEGGFQYVFGGPYTAEDGLAELSCGLDLAEDEDDDCLPVLTEDEEDDCVSILREHRLEAVWSWPPEDEKELTSYTNEC